MSRNKEMKGLNYLEHKPGVKIKENSIMSWCDNLNQFKDWEFYVPDCYIARIKEQAAIPNVKDRNYIAFDTKYLLSV